MSPLTKQIYTFADTFQKLHSSTNWKMLDLLLPNIIKLFGYLMKVIPEEGRVH